MSARQLVSVDPELGPIRFCRGCQEWWPDDDGFWYLIRHHAGERITLRGRPYIRKSPTTVRRCRACHAGVARRADQRRRGESWMEVGDKTLPLSGRSATESAA